MKKKQWILVFYLDEEKICERKVESWFDGLLEMAKYFEKDIPYCVSLDFTFVEGDAE